MHTEYTQYVHVRKTHTSIYVHVNRYTLSTRADEPRIKTPSLSAACGTTWELAQGAPRAARGTSTHAV